MIEDRYLLDGSNDHRRGISLYAVPDDKAREGFSNVIGELLDVEPDQYGYSAKDLHLTILTLVSVSLGADITPEMSRLYAEVCSRVLVDARPFRVFYNGLILAPDSIIVKGYPCDRSLNSLRESLRQELHGSGVSNTVDVRYKTQTAHNTIFRFRKPLHSGALLQRKVEDISNALTGYVDYSVARLSIHDWYMRERSVTVLNEFSLAEQE
jgi:hypothetical protein